LQKYSTELPGLAFYCASGELVSPCYRISAHRAGELCAKNAFRLVYGAGSVGLMGKLAEGAFFHGGPVTGVIPTYLLTKEQPFDWLRNAPNMLVEVSDMTERRDQFRARSIASVVLSGGMGTLTEMAEDLTLEQIGQRSHPTIIVNENGYWDHQLAQYARMRQEQAIRPGLDFREIVISRIDDLFPTLHSVCPQMSQTVIPFMQARGSR